MREVVIASAARTPIGSFGGTLKNTPAVTLGKTAVEEAVKRAGIKPEQVDELVFGCVLQAGLGQNVARQVSLAAGLPIAVPNPCPWLPMRCPLHAGVQECSTPRWSTLW